MKLNVLLALTDQLRTSYKNMIADYGKFFSKSQGAFRGEKRTYTPREGTIDDPSKRGVINVTTTIKEKLDYFIESSAKFIDALFSQEKTNASGVVEAELIVNGNTWGKFTSLELLRLKSLLESNDLGKLEEMISNIPVRNNSEIWMRSKDPEYEDREVYETEQFKGVAKTTVKTEYVLSDPNLKGRELPANYSPAISHKDSILELGDYTRQTFSGEWSHQQRALTLKRRANLLTAITEALKNANEVESVKSELTAKRIFEYLFFE